MTSNRRGQIPIAVKVEDLASLVRLVASRGDYFPPLLYFENNSVPTISHLYSIPLQRGNLPILFYAALTEKPKKFVVYTPLEREETKFSDIPETGRYVSYPVIEAEPPPELFVRALNEQPRRKLSGFEKVHVKDVGSLMRIVSAMSDDAFSPPVWCYQGKTGRNLAVLYPIYEYYDSAVLPLLYYTTVERKPTAPFIAYSASENSIKYGYSISDARYVYGRIIFIEKFPLDV
ncbi:MAG: hypothetical protein QXY84_04265 [Candidatus Caldarchaeum sp.]